MRAVWRASAIAGACLSVLAQAQVDPDRFDEPSEPTDPSDEPVQFQVYCRVIEKLLTKSRDYLAANLDTTYFQDLSYLGTVEVGIHNISIKKIEMINCSAVVEGDLLTVGAPEVQVEFQSMTYAIDQKAFPYASTGGTVKGNGTFFFNASVDVRKFEDKLFQLKFSQLDIQVISTYVPLPQWVIESAFSFARLPMSAPMEQYSKEFFDSQLDLLRENNKCDLMQDMISNLDLSGIHFETTSPMIVNLPLATMEVNVNSTEVQAMTKLQCQDVFFDGRVVTARVQGVHFDAAFDWSYKHHGQPVWMMHNRGVGVVNTTGVIQVRINLLKPDASAMHIALPSLYVRLDPETHVIIYRTIDMIATPAIRSAIETIGNDRVNKKLVACMRDPECMDLQSKTEGPGHSQMLLAAWSDFVV